jgi:hypothetical protein
MPAPPARRAGFFWATPKLRLKRCRPVGEVERPVAFYRLVQSGAFGPEEIALMTEAYERGLLALGIVDRENPINEQLARKIIEIAARGVRDSRVLFQQAILEMII